MSFIGLDGMETNPLPSKYRNHDDFSTLLPKLDRRTKSIKCFQGKWDAERIGIENVAEIEGVVFRKDRGSKCLLFSAYDNTAMLEAVMKENKRKEEVIDRKVTRRMAWIAIVFSFIATLLAPSLSYIFSRIFRQ
jgi:hypothetical protein